MVNVYKVYKSRASRAYQKSSLFVYMKNERLSCLIKVGTIVCINNVVVLLYVDIGLVFTVGHQRSYSVCV